MSVTAFLDINRGERLFCTAQWPRAWQSRNKSAMKFPSLSLLIFQRFPWPSPLASVVQTGPLSLSTSSGLGNAQWILESSTSVPFKQRNQIISKQKSSARGGRAVARKASGISRFWEKIGEWRTRQWMIQRSHIVCRKAKVTTVIMSSPVVCGFKCTSASAAVRKLS